MRQNLQLLRMLPLLFILPIFLCFSSCKESPPPPSVGEIAEEIRQELTFPAMVRLGKDQLSNYFNLTPDLFEEFEVFISDEDQKVDEYAVFEMKTDTDPSDVYHAVSKRIAERSSNFKQMPQEYSKLQNNVLRQKEQIMILIVCAESQRAADLLESMGATPVTTK